MIDIFCSLNFPLLNKVYNNRNISSNTSILYLIFFNELLQWTLPYLWTLIWLLLCFCFLILIASIDASFSPPIMIVALLNCNQCLRMNPDSRFIQNKLADLMLGTYDWFLPKVLTQNLLFSKILWPIIWASVIVQFSLLTSHAR